MIALQSQLSVIAEHDVRDHEQLETCLSGVVQVQSTLLSSTDSMMELQSKVRSLETVNIDLLRRLASHDQAVNALQASLSQMSDSVADVERSSALTTRRLDELIAHWQSFEQPPGQMDPDMLTHASQESQPMDC